MEEEYKKNYGVSGHVIYPSKARDRAVEEGSPGTYGKHDAPLVGAYAGNIFSGAYAKLIAELAERLERRGGSLLLFGPHSPKQLRSLGLDRKNVILQGLVSSEELIARLREEADFVFVPMAFDADGSELNMRLGFPSKLTDYTATGLPLLIWGPDYCSAARWAVQHSPLAELVRSQKLESNDASPIRLERPEHREILGKNSTEVGDRLFSHQAAVDVFYGAVAI